VTPTPAGAYFFHAVDSIRAYHVTAVHTCDLPTFNKASPTITTTLSATTITVGASVTDSSTMASFFQAGGTVTYNRFSGATCAGTDRKSVVEGKSVDVGRSCVGNKTTRTGR